MGSQANIICSVTRALHDTEKWVFWGGVQKHTFSQKKNYALFLKIMSSQANIRNTFFTKVLHNSGRKCFAVAPMDR